MKSEDVRMFESLLRRALEALKVAVGETSLALDLLVAHRHTDSAPSHGQRVSQIVDDGRFSVRWNERECSLGQTLVFRLFRRLALSPNQYVSHQQILDDLWGGEASASAVKSVVRDLRRKLVDGGMADLARAIDGGNAGHYGLCLDRLASALGPHRDPTKAPP